MIVVHNDVQHDCYCFSDFYMRIFYSLLMSSQVVGSTSNPQVSGEGLYFCDGQRKVDYVLVFHQRRHGSIRSPASTSVSQDRLSIVSNGNFPPTGASDVAPARGDEPADHEMHLIRQEFEANLIEAGLEIERDRELKAHGPSFTRLHAPWPVLCREAEFLKIKVPTKTVSSQCITVGCNISSSFESHFCIFFRYNITSKDTFFDNATRGRIVYEILRRTVCARTSGCPNRECSDFVTG
uniref:Anoctamin dimerisation domain-containing protein n=1 Tax=Amphiprion percula TaxID=161767 RepID=A0A3P8U079_AMPPE